MNFNSKPIPFGDVRETYEKAMDENSMQAKLLKNGGAEKIYACHCTGFKGFDLMDEILGDKILYLGGGEALEF